MAVTQRTTESSEPAADSNLDADEFAAQFKESFRILWLIAVGILGDASAAEDVVQEAAIVALGKLDSFERGTNFTAWMGQMVRFIALNHRRRQRRHMTVPLEDEEGRERVDTIASGRQVRPSGEVRAGLGGTLPSDHDVFDDRLVAALADVAEVARTCLFLRTLESMEYSQIARLLDIPEGTAMSHVHRTRRYLRERLGADRAAKPDIHRGDRP